MDHIMLDLETMSTEANAAIIAIIAIGAVKFDPELGVLGQEFYCTVDLASSMNRGGSVSSSTILWWLQQSDEARKKVTEPGQDLLEALFAFRTFVGNDNPYVCMWGNGAAFDNVVLATAYKRVGITPPWRFYNDRCYRTLKNLFPAVPMERVGTHHNALDDAKSQALHTIAIFKEMQKS